MSARNLSAAQQPSSGAVVDVGELSQPGGPAPLWVIGLVVSLTAAVALWGFWRAFMLRGMFVLDELPIFEQVQLFLRGKWELMRWPGSQYPVAAMFPGFSAVLAAFGAATGLSSAAALRTLCFAFSLAQGAMLYAVARHFFAPPTAWLRTAQGYLLPVLFPFQCLLYTDAFSLLITLTAFWAYLARRERLGGALALLSLFVRQTNVVFLAFLWAFTFVDRYGFHVAWPEIAAHARRCWLLVFGCVAFVVFVMIHGRVGLDHPVRQPLEITPGNLAFSLVTAGIAFLPLHLAHVRAVVQWAREQWRIALSLALAAMIVGLFYSPTHPWNSIPGLLRNDFLAFLTHGPAGRLLFGGIMTATIWSIAATPLVRSAAVPVYAFWLCTLVPVVLVEPRYYISSFALFSVLRRSETMRVELAIWVWLAILSVWLDDGTVSGRFLP